MGRLAAMIPMSLSAFSRGVEDGTLSLENCLRLARAVGENPGRILRLAGKPPQADLLDHFTRETEETLSTRAIRLAQVWDTLDPKIQDAVEAIVEHGGPLKAKPPKPREPQERVAKAAADDGHNSPTAPASAQLHPLEVYRCTQGLSWDALAREISLAVGGRRRSSDCIRKICLGETTRINGTTKWIIDTFLAKKAIDGSEA